jgi:hypothetical protein
VQRHGKAVEPLLPQGASAGELKIFTPEENGEEDAVAKGKDLKKKAQELEEQGEQQKSQQEDAQFSSAAPLSEETQAAMRLPGDLAEEPVAAEKVTPSADEPTLRQQAAKNTTDPLAPLETVLQMPPPETAEEENASKPPHLQTPPYVHHFDTYTLVQQVEAGGFTTEQSITAMKAVRGLLALNLDVARAGLVSKNDIENVSPFYAMKIWE